MNIKCLLISLFIFCAAATVSANDITTSTLEEYRMLGAKALAEEDYNKALGYYSKALGLGDRNPEIANDLAILYERIGNDARAEQLYLDAIRFDKTYLPPYMNLAYLYLKYGNHEDAAKYFRLRYELSPTNDPWGKKAMEELLIIKPAYRNWILTVEAEKLKKEVVEHERKEFQRKIALSRTHFKQGKKFYHEGEYKEAIIEYSKALNLTPDDRDIRDALKEARLDLTRENVEEHSEQAIRLLEAGDTIAAKSKFREILSTIPSNSH